MIQREAAYPPLSEVGTNKCFAFLFPKLQNEEINDQTLLFINYLINQPIVLAIL